MEINPLSITQKQPIILPWGGFILCMVAYLFGGTASTLMATYLPVAVPQLLGGSPSANQVSETGAWISAAFLYGWMTGGLLFGPLADKLGRVRALALATGLCGIAMLATVFVPNESFLVILRALTGAGVGGILLVSTVYLSEVWPVPSRPIVLGVLATTFPVGIVATGGLASGFSDWRSAFGIGIVPLIVACLVGVLLPESGIWQRGRSETRADKPNLFQAENRANVISGAIIFGAVLIGLWGIFSWLPTWIQSLLPAGRSGQTERGITMVLLGIGGIAGGIASGFLVTRLGATSDIAANLCGLHRCLWAALSDEPSLLNRYLWRGGTAIPVLWHQSGSAIELYTHLIPQLKFGRPLRGFVFNVGRLFTATSVLFVGALTVALGGIGNALVIFSAAFMIAFGAVWLKTK